jgi:hypothetical protein
MKTIAQQLNITEFPFIIKDKNGNETYYEDSNGGWYKREYDSNGNKPTTKIQQDIGTNTNTIPIGI